LLSITGAAGGVLLAWALTQAAMSAQLPIAIPFSFGLQIDNRVLGFTTAVSLIAGIIAGLAPALKATKPNLTGELKGETVGVITRRWTMRDTLVAGQMAVTMTLLVAAGLLARSLAAAQRIGVGFKTEGVAVVSTELEMIGYNSDRALQFYQRALERVR